MLEVAIGIVFILLVLSLFATTLMEIIASIFSLRGKHLTKGLNRMLGSSGEKEDYEQFINHPLYQQIKSKFLLIDRPPSYMSSKMFSSVLFDTLLKEEQYDGENEEAVKEVLSKKIEEIKDPNLKHVLNQYLQEAKFKLPDFKLKIEEWYDEVMDRVSGWYKRNTQAILIFLGLFIAVAFDADTVNIFHELSNDPATRADLVRLVDEYSATIDTTNSETFTNSKFKGQLDDLIQEEFDAYFNRSEEKLGLGWYEATTPTEFWGWFYKVLGWLVTAFAISLGAPFWFGLLKKIMNLRSSGGVPQVISVATTKNDNTSKSASSEKPTSSITKNASNSDGNTEEPVG